MTKLICRITYSIYGKKKEPRNPDLSSDMTLQIKIQMWQFRKLRLLSTVLRQGEKQKSHCALPQAPDTTPHNKSTYKAKHIEDLI